MVSEKSELPQEIDIKDLEHGPRTIDIETTEEQRAAIADRLSIDAISALSGSVTLELPSHRNALFEGSTVNGHGRLKVRYQQTCVVTLEPFEKTQEISFEGVFSEDDPGEHLSEDEDEALAGLPDILGAISDDTISVGEAVIEQFALEIDPFPRKPDAEFDGFSVGSSGSDDDKTESPFAVLAKLKDNLE